MILRRKLYSSPSRQFKYKPGDKILENIPGSSVKDPKSKLVDKLKYLSNGEKLAIGGAVLLGAGYLTKKAYDSLKEEEGTEDKEIPISKIIKRVREESKI